MAQFCTVTRVLSAAHIDGFDEDANPDIHPVQGEVTFTPLIPEGDAIHLFEDGRPKTIVPLPIKTRISDGVIFHRGESSIKLLAGGDRMNPPKLYWRASFAHMQSNGIPFKLKPIVFEAIPDGTVDLTAVAPVVGIDPPTAKGRDGDVITDVKAEGPNIVVTVKDADGVTQSYQISISQAVKAIANDAVTRTEKAAESATLSRQQSEASASSALASATAAAESVSGAKESELRVASSISEAANSAASAKQSAESAASSSSAAQASESAARNSEHAAAGHAETAKASVNAVSKSASDASASASNAAESASAAARSASQSTEGADTATAQAVAAAESAKIANTDAARATSEADRASASAERATEIAVGTIPGATTESRGTVKLAGDLAGSADTPTVPGLSTKVNASDASEGSEAGTIAKRGPQAQIAVGLNPPTDSSAASRAYVTALRSGLSEYPNERVDVGALVVQNRAGLEPSHPYSDPSPEEVTAVEAAVNALMRGDTVVAPAGTEVLYGWDESAKRAVRVLRSVPGNGKYWGLWVFPVGEPVTGVIEAPHPVFDAGSDDIAVEVWRRSPMGTVLAVAGSHRTNPDGTDPRDVCKNKNSMWHKVTTSIAQPGLPELQLHGFGDDSLPGVGAVISSGSSPLSAGVIRLDRFLSAAGVATARQWDGSATKLIGMLNAQGDAAAVRGNAFCHVEMSNTTRTAGRESFVKGVTASRFLDGRNATLLTNEFPMPVGSVNSRGESATAARADHSHRLVQNDPQDGEIVARDSGGWRSIPAKQVVATGGGYVKPDSGIPSTDLAQDLKDMKASVDAATYSATANTLMKRTSTGAVSVADPTASVHAANKKYVDGIAAAKADVVGGQIPTSQLPAVALTKPQVVSDRAGMLALTAQEGDVAVITAGVDKGTYMLGGGASTTFESWVKLSTPDGGVTSVNGQTGVVNLNAANVGAAPTSHQHTASTVTTSSGSTVQSALDSLSSGLSAKLDSSQATGFASLYKAYDFAYSTRSTISTSGANLAWKKLYPDRDSNAYDGIGFATGLWMVNVSIAFDSFYNAKYAVKLVGGTGSVLGYEVSSGDSSWDTVKQHTFIVDNTSGTESSFTVNFTGSATAYVGINRNNGVRNQLTITKLA